MSAKQELKSFFTAHWKYMVVSAACKLNLFDSIKQGFTDAAAIAQHEDWDAHQLGVLLNALVEFDFLTKTGGVYQLTEYAELLTEDHAERLKYACQIWSSDHLDAWQNLPALIQTGKSPFILQRSQSYFDFLNENPDKLVEYHRAMYEYARDDYRNSCASIDFHRHASIMDVGGGFGALIQIIKQNHPRITCHLMDLNKVVDHLRLPDINLHSGDFFQYIPTIADGLILSRILHDWDDDRALIILEKCREALPEKGRLYIIENCTDELVSELPLLNLNMALMCDSFERTTEQFKALANTVGFNFIEKTALNDLQTILTFEK